MSKTPNRDALIAEGLLSATPRRDRVRRLLARTGPTGPAPAVIAIKGMLTEAYGASIREKIAAAWRAPKIVLYIDSPGGLASVGTAIAEDLKQLDRPIEAHGLGTVASAAVRIFATAQTRSARPSTRFTIHRCSVSKDAIDSERVTARDLQRLTKIMLKNDKSELQWLQKHGIALQSRQIDRYLAGEDVRLDGRAAKAAGLVQTLDPDPTEAEQQRDRMQGWQRYARESKAARSAPRSNAQAHAAKAQALARWHLWRDHFATAGMQDMVQDFRARMLMGCPGTGARPIGRPFRPVII